MYKNISLLVLLFISSFSIVAQENNLENQFNEVLKKSNNYQEYKVIKKVEINSLKKNVLDTVAALEQNIASSSLEIEEQKSVISSLNNELETTKNELTVSKKKEEGIQLMGVITNKSTYNAVAFSLIGILLLTIFVLFYKFKNSNSVTISTLSKLSEIEEELDSFRLKTIERDQQLRRKLQDEINKNRDS